MDLGPYAWSTNSLPIANGTISPYLLTLVYRYDSAIVPLSSLLVLHAYGPCSQPTSITFFQSTHKQANLWTNLRIFGSRLQYSRFCTLYLRAEEKLGRKTATKYASEWLGRQQSRYFMKMSVFLFIIARIKNSKYTFPIISWFFINQLGIARSNINYASCHVCSLRSSVE